MVCGVVVDVYSEWCGGGVGVILMLITILRSKIILFLFSPQTLEISWHIAFLIVQM